MVKKKKDGQSEPAGKKHDEPTDNKTNNNSSEINDTEKSGNPPVTGTGIPSGDSSSKEGTSSDKIVNGEKPSEEKLAEMQDKYIRLSA